MPRALTYSTADTLPKLTWPAPDTVQQLAGLHDTFAFVLIGLGGVHIGAALVHIFIYRDGVMRRMLSMRSKRY